MARKLSRKTGPRLALLRNLSSSLIVHEQIRTTLPKSKELKSFLEKIINRAKPSDITSRRLVAKDIKEPVAFEKIFKVIVPRYKERTSGYTRIFRLGARRGDSAEQALVKLVP